MAIAKSNLNVKKHKILIIDKKRLILCGLLSKQPTKSKVVQRILTPQSSQYTAAQKMHIVATYWTPELARSWVYYQFERLGGKEGRVQKIFERIAYEEPARSKYTWMGTNNLQFIGNDEIERYYLRRNPNMKMTHPSWAIPYFNDSIKQGCTLQQISEKLEITLNQVKHVVYEIAPRGMFKPNIKNPNLGNPWRK